MPVAISILNDPGELRALIPAWEDLLRRSNTNEPMLSPIWLLPWWRVFGARDGRRLVVLACRDGTRLVGLAPLLARPHRYPPGIPFRRLELLGTGEAEGDEVCSEYVGLLAERGAEARVATELVDALVRGALGPWDEVVMTAMNGECPLISPLLAALQGAGIESWVESTGSAPYIALPSSFAEYLGALSSSSRYLVTRARRDVERWAGGEVELHVASSEATFEEGRRLLCSLHAERWSGGGAFTSPYFRAFHDEVMPALMQRGALSLAWLTARKVPIAAAYGIVWEGRLYFYQAGRSLDVPRGIRPGIALHAAMIQRSIKQGLREYDFLEGHSRYKRQLANRARTLVRLRGVRVPDGPRERTRRLCERGAQEARMLGYAIGRRVEAGPEPRLSPPAVLPGDLNMLRCFARSGIRTVVLASDPDAPSFFSRHCGQRRIIADVGTAPDTTLADLLALGRVFEDRPVLFYGDDAMLLLVSRHRAELATYFRLLLPEADLVETLVDKVRFAAFAEARGLPVPRTVASSVARSAAEIAGILAPPWIVKPFCHLGFRTSRTVVELGVGPVKGLRASTVDELARAVERMERFTTDFVVQEYIPGGEDCVMSFHAYVDACRRPLGSFTGRKIRTYPRSAGASTYLELVDAPDLMRQGFDVLDRIGLVGVVKLDFKRNPCNGRLSLLEVNPRFNLWNHLGAAAGVNLPLLAYRDLTGGPVQPTGPARSGMRWLSLADDARTFLRDYWPAGELSIAAWLSSLRGPKVYDIFAWDDPSPFVMNALAAVRRGMRR